MTPERAALTKRAILTPLAVRHSLDYDMEALAPNRTDAAQAFAFLTCGADLVLSFTDPEGFPTEDRKTRKRGLKAVLNNVAGPGGQEATIYLASAMALWHEWALPLAGHAELADSHRTFGELIGRMYPLSLNAQAKLGRLCREYLVLQTHKIPEAGHIATGYHMALLDPTFSEFANVDDDLRLVEAQQTYAGNYLRHQAILDAIEMVIGEDQFSDLLPTLLYPESLAYAKLTYQLGLGAIWVSISDAWAAHARRATDVERVPEPLEDGVAEYLRRRVLVLLENPGGPMPLVAAGLGSSYAFSVTTRQADSDCITDSLIVGYCLRRGEEDLIDHRVLDRQIAVTLLRANDDDPTSALKEAREIIDEDLPEFFSRGEVAWDQIREWASEYALERARQRQRLGMTEVGAPPPSVGTDECCRAFEFGYALRAGMTGLFGEEP